MRLPYELGCVLLQSVTLSDSPSCVSLFGPNYFVIRTKFIQLLVGPLGNKWLRVLCRCQLSHKLLSVPLLVATHIRGQFYAPTGGWDNLNGTPPLSRDPIPLSVRFRVQWNPFLLTCAGTHSVDSPCSLASRALSQTRFCRLGEARTHV